MPPWLPPAGGEGCEALPVSSRPRAAVPGRSVSLLLASVLLAGCGAADATGTASSGSSGTHDTSGTSAPASPGEVVESAADGGTAAAASWPADVAADTSEASPGASVTVSDIRFGVHDGFDRVVLEVGGEGLPGWDVRYVDQASSQGSGEAVDVAGNAVLQVSLTGAGYPYHTGVQEVPRGRSVSAPGAGTVTDVVFDATFEGTTVAFVGTTEQAPFRVYLLEAPTRVVLEVQHAG